MVIAEVLRHGHAARGGAKSTNGSPAEGARCRNPDVRMTNEFATTVAAVAPVIMLVASVEVSSNRERVRHAFERDAEMSRVVADLFSGGADPTRSEYEQVRQRLRELRTGRFKRQIYVFYVVTAFFVMTSLVLAEVLALGWLAGRNVETQAVDAALCYYILIFSFVWVALLGLAQMFAGFSGDERPRREALWHIRYWALHWRYRRPESGQPAAAGEGDASPRSE
ncbi:hypothetical protein Q3A86_16940 [Streptomyces sp. NBUA17]|uniref:hypothetical protein n=1 Tax=Streptomyces sp. NBUA17 TaxID=3062275 RepID=UPI0037D9EB00